ncbi:MAG: exodeoxyribonuclease VII small subunit [Comamonadaceae bacterium]|nr:exodeoxyribonuclease VII small subunit [Comamonadaceae bacterium]
MPRKPAASAHTPALPATYSEAVAELERIIDDLESGQLPLEDLLSHYQRGAALLAHCRERLQTVEEQVKRLDNGVLKPWSPEDEA